MPVSGRMNGEGGPKVVSSFDGPVAGAPMGLRAMASRFALLPLRLFLGITFVYAGLDKLTDSTFLTGSGPDSLEGMLAAVHDTAALTWMVDLAQKSPQGFGTAIAVGELAVGLGTLFGLWGRVAAAGGAVISFSLWMTVSWASTPYYYGNDLAYLMAWLPLLMAGTPMFSLDAALAQRRRRRGQQIFG